MTDYDRNRLETQAERHGGVVIVGCRPGSPADRAGAKAYDLLLEVDGVSVETPMEAVAALTKAGPYARLSMIRDETPVTLSMRRLGVDGDLEEALRNAEPAGSGVRRIPGAESFGGLVEEA